MKLSDVVELIRGKPGTIVRLEVMPADGSAKKIYKIAREKIALTDSEAQGKIFDVGKKPDGSPYRIGVIDLPSFYRDTDAEHRGRPDFKSATRDVRVILDDFRSKGVDAVVLDLRSNGGGALNEAISLTGLFINDGPVVQVKDADGHVQRLRRQRRGRRLVGAAGRDDQQVQRQRQRNPRRRDPGLRSRTDRRRPLDPRQGNGAEPAGRVPAVVRRSPPPGDRWAR